MRLTTLVLVAAASLAVPIPVRAANQDAGPASSSGAAHSPNIAISPATAPYIGVHAIGKPRVSAKHPNVFWDQEDIDHYKEMLRSSRELQTQFDGLKRGMDEVVSRPVSVPEPRKGPDGQWLYPGEYFPPFPGAPDNSDGGANFRRFFVQATEEVSNLGTVYVLTGDEKYAKHARDLLIGYANCSRYGAPPGMDKRRAMGLFGQLLDEALLLQVLTRGYDLISSSQSVSAADRTRIHDELLRPLAMEMVYPAFADFNLGASFASQPNNRGAIGAASVLLVGYATDDQELIDAGLYGVRANSPVLDPVGRKQFPPPKNWTVATADNPSGGLLTVFFAPTAIPGGMWVEGSPGYTFYALGSLINAAEAAWRHGLDLYSYDNAIFKHLFDYPLNFAYPDLTFPAENDSRRDSMLGGDPPRLYEYAYRRYRDPRYLALINTPQERAFLGAAGAPFFPKAQSVRSLGMNRIGAVPPSFLYDLDPNEPPGRIEPVNVNYAAVGFGILRTPAANGLGVESLILSYGPSASHGHPDKLHIDLFAFNDVLMPSPGVNYPYNKNPLLPNWYHTTVAHNTMVVDEGVQDYHQPNGRQPDVRADQTVYAPAETMALERAWTDTAYPGVLMDRAVFLNRWYLADLFSAASDKPHTYDLAWHIRGVPSSSLDLKPAPFPDPVPVGYNQLTNVRQSQPTSAPWAVTVALKANESRLLAAGGDATRAIVGEGGIYVDFTSNAPNKRPEAPTILQRREGARSTIFGNVLDLSSKANGYVKSVTQGGGIDSGFATLKIDTIDGEDFCLASYRSGEHRADGLETDALQAFASSAGSRPRALYLAGGTFLKLSDASLKRSVTGLAYVETRQDGVYVIGNPSPTPATVTIKLKALDGLEAFNLGPDGKPAGKADVTVSGEEIALPMKAASQVGFFPRGKS